jgi:transmembrane sensor
MTSMVETSPGSIPRQILEEAADWFVEFRVDEIDSAARERFDHWLRQSPQHVQAYLDIASTYAGLPAGKTAAAVDVNAVIARAQSGPVADVIPLARVSMPGRPGKKPLRRLHLAAAAAIAVIAAFLGWLGVRNHEVYSTGVGEERSMTLADGSVVELNARSRIRIHFSRAERGVDLIKGEAFFTVVRNPHYPFVVHSGELAVRDVGTEFDINRQVTRTVVTVLEGRIEMSARNERTNGLLPAPSLQDAPMSAPMTVSAGQQVIVGPDGASSVPPPQSIDPAEVAAWRRHRLIFDSSPLADVVDEFNRYNRRQLVIVSPQLAGLEISGVYSSTNPDSFVRFLRAQPGLGVEESDGKIRISQLGSN